MKRQIHILSIPVNRDYQKYVYLEIGLQIRSTFYNINDQVFSVPEAWLFKPFLNHPKAPDLTQVHPETSAIGVNNED